MGGRHRGQWDTEGTSLGKEVSLKSRGESGTELSLCQIMIGLEKAKECNSTGTTE